MKMACLGVKIVNATIDNYIVVFELMVSFDACELVFCDLFLKSIDVQRE